MSLLPSFMATEIKEQTLVVGQKQLPLERQRSFKVFLL